MICLHMDLWEFQRLGYLNSVADTYTNIIFILFLIVCANLIQIKTRNQCNLQFYSTYLSGRGRPNPIVPPELTSLTCVLPCWPSIMHGPVFPWLLIESQHLRVVIFNLLYLICDTSTRVSWIMQTETLIVGGIKINYLQMI